MTFVDGGETKYKTHKFGKSVLQQMYKYYQEEQFCDFKIKVENKVFNVSWYMQYFEEIYLKYILLYVQIIYHTCMCMIVCSGAVY